MDIIELEQLQQCYLKDSQKIMNTLINEIKLREKGADLIINQRNQKIAALEEENTQLNHTIDKLYAELSKVNNRLDELASKLYKQETIVLEEASEEEYEEVIDCCLQAYINEQYKVVKRCIKEIIRNYNSYKEFITLEHSITLLLISFFQEDDDRFNATYHEYIDGTFEEYQLYSQLKALRNQENIQIEVYEERMKSLKLENVHSYVIDELKEDIYRYIEIKLGVMKENRKQAELVVNNTHVSADSIKESIKVKVPKLYEMDRLMNRIETAFRGSDKKTLQRLFNHLLANKQYYEKELKREQIQALLCMSYFQEYDKFFISKYGVIREFVETNESKLYKLLVDEKKKEGYKVSKECLIEYMRSKENHIVGFGDFKTSYMKRRLQEVAMPSIDKLYEEMEDKVCIHSSEFHRGKWVWMRNLKMNQYIGFKALYCSKCDRYYISKAELNKLNNYLAPYQINTISLMQLAQKNEYREKENGLNTTSILKAMGYETSKPKEERWRLLKHSIIPKLGKAKVVNHLRFLIRLHQATPQMANAVSEWEYDLCRLER